MEFNWNDRGTGGDHDGGFFRPLCPDGYAGLGSVGEQFFSDDDMNPTPSYWPGLKCIKSKYLVDATFDSLTWADHGSGGSHDGSVFAGLEDTLDGEQLVGPCLGFSGYPSKLYWLKLNPELFNSVSLRMSSHEFPLGPIP